MSNKNFMSYSDAETVLTEFANNIKAMGNADSYSTDEVRTNKVWIDGKPIYRKVLLTTGHGYINGADGTFTRVAGWTLGDSNTDAITYFSAPTIGVGNNLYYDSIGSDKWATTPKSVYVYEGTPLIIEYTKKTN